MAKFDYSRPAAIAKRLLDRFGQAGAISRSTPGGYDPETGPTAPVELQSPCTVALLEFNNRQIDGELVKVGDRRALIAPDAVFEPEAGDVLTVGSEAVQVVRNRPLKPAGVIVLHDCIVRDS